MRPDAPLLAAEINALPQRVRAYIHDVETRTDPTGDVQIIAALTEQRDALLLDRAELVTVLGLPAATTWADALAEVARLRDRVATHTRKSLEWAAQNPERTREINREAARRYRERRKEATRG